MPSCQEPDTNQDRLVQLAAVILIRGARKKKVPPLFHHVWACAATPTIHVGRPAVNPGLRPIWEAGLYALTRLVTRRSRLVYNRSTPSLIIRCVGRRQ